MHLSQEDIQQLIPHRPPFLWIDEVIEITEHTIIASKYLAEEIDLFQGHYPQFPVLPGVIQCEAAFQAGALLIAHSASIDDNKIPVVTRLNNTKFRRMVRPGETLHIEVELTDVISTAWCLKGKLSVVGEIATRLEFICTAADPL